MVFEDHARGAKGTQATLMVRGHHKCPKCPSSDAFHVWDDGHGHCFSCGFHQYPNMTIESLKSSLKSNEKKSKFHYEISLPADFDYHIPSEAMAWLYKYNLTRLEIHRNKIGWTETFQSLVFPVFGVSQELLLFQARYFGPNDKVPKWKTFGSVKDLIHLPEKHNDDVLVLVEDIISAIKVSRVKNCMPLFGSHLPLETVRRVSKLFRTGRIWLDSDKRPEALKMALACSEYGMPTTVIFTDKDPKEYPTADIRELVQ